jgi:hypothetical protein
MCLWSEYDVESAHRRRYTRHQLEARLAEAGFLVNYCTEFMVGLLPLMWLRRRMAWSGSARREGAASPHIKNELQVNPLLNRALELVLRPEPSWIQRRQRLPWGTSLLALASRNDH